MANRNIIAGLDIGTAWIRLVVCELKAGDNVPQILTLVKKPARGLRRGYVINPDETTEAIREAVADAERTLKTKVRKIILGIGGVSLDSRLAEGSIVASRPDSDISNSDVARSIDASEANLMEMNNRRILHRIPIAFKVDGEKVLGHPDGLRGSKLEVKTLFITCLDQHLKDLIRAIENAGLIVDDIVASPLAASLVVTTKNQKAAGCALANIGSQTTSVAIFEDGLPVSLQVFPLGSMDITNDIALGFRIPLEDAERVKKGEGEPIGTKKKLDEIIEARLSDIFEFIERHLKKIGVAGLLPAGIIITGGGSSVSNIEDLAKNYFKLPARIASATIATSSKSQIRDTAWAVAYGLCAYVTEDGGDESFGLKLVKNARGKLWGWIREFMP
ncbi:MAG: cell division protein FtsA [Candidatus Paceibacterota bacterium]